MQKDKGNKRGNAALASFFCQTPLPGSRMPGEHGVKVPLRKQQQEVWVYLLFWALVVCVFWSTKPCREILLSQIFPVGPSTRRCPRGCLVPAAATPRGDAGPKGPRAARCRHLHHPWDPATEISTGKSNDPETSQQPAGTPRDGRDPTGRPICRACWHLPSRGAKK